MKIIVILKIFIVIILSCVIVALAWRGIQSYQNKAVVKDGFDKTILLKEMVEDCYKEHKNIDICNSGFNGIPAPYKDNYNVIEVQKGIIYIAFTGDDVSKNLSGSAAQIYFDTKAADEGKNPWTCKFQDTFSNKVDISIVPKGANCSMRYQ